MVLDVPLSSDDTVAEFFVGMAFASVLLLLVAVGLAVHTVAVAGGSVDPALILIPALTVLVTVGGVVHRRQN